MLREQENNNIVIYMPAAHPCMFQLQAYIDKQLNC